MNDYIKEKIKVLKELGIYLTYDETAHFYTLANEIQIDNYGRKLIVNRDRSKTNYKNLSLRPNACWKWHGAIA